jgi:signal transduction histidine kinase
MHDSSYIRFVYLTAGTLLPFFWMIVILGHRRQRNLERIFFFLCLALALFFGSHLLALNSQIYYGNPPKRLLSFAWVFLCLGLWFVPPLLIHLHVEYASLRELISTRVRKVLWLLVAYAPAVLLTPKLLAALRFKEAVDFEAPSRQLGIEFQTWLVLSILIAALWQWKFSKIPLADEQKTLFRELRWNFLVLAAFLSLMLYAQHRWGNGATAGMASILSLLVLMPFIVMIREVRRFNFLDIGRQRNLIYAVFLVFVALLYLSLVRRAGQWLEPYLPPEASAALLLFLPVVFFEPLQRVMGKLLRRTAQREVDRAQRLLGPINEVARRGDLEKLKTFSERWIAEQLQLAEAELALDSNGATRPSAVSPRGGSFEPFEIWRAGQHLGALHVRSHGAMISGETYAALEFVCEQLPAAFDLCRLIEEKLQLERELAERERLALVGQMAASISHSLKNPLGSIKTILQVQMESPELPAPMKQETQMVLNEIRRLSETLNQLLQFSRPGIRSRGEAGTCDAARVAESVASMLGHEAENRGLVLEVTMNGQPLEVAASAEVANDILSNLVLNALEATSRGGRVQVSLGTQDGHCSVSVSDDGAGIPAALKEKILQPFFTTKARGTGLGLAIVSRRLQEIGGTLKVDSPIRGDRGSRFRALLPLAAKDTRS